MFLHGIQNKSIGYRTCRVSVFGIFENFNQLLLIL
jgi:hypothetical protein